LRVLATSRSARATVTRVAKLGPLEPQQAPRKILRPRAVAMFGLLYDVNYCEWVATIASDRAVA